MRSALIQRLLSLVLAVPVLVLLWLLAGFVGAAIPGGGSHKADGSPSVEVRLLAGSIHYDFLLPATPETRAAFAFAQDAGVPVDDPGNAWLVVGWGARDFYTTSATYADMTPGPILRAITGDASVMRVDGWRDFDPTTAGVEVEVLNMPAATYTRLLTAIAASTDGKVLDHPGFTPTDRFFGGEGGFSLVRTCNVWVGEMLRAAGLRLGVWTPTPQALRLSLTLYVKD